MKLWTKDSKMSPTRPMHSWALTMNKVEFKKEEKKIRTKKVEILLPFWTLVQTLGDQCKRMWTRNLHYHEIKAVKHWKPTQWKQVFIARPSAKRAKTIAHKLAFIFCFSKTYLISSLNNPTILYWWPERHWSLLHYSRYFLVVGLSWPSDI